VVVPDLDALVRGETLGRVGPGMIHSHILRPLAAVGAAILRVSVALSEPLPPVPATVPAARTRPDRPWRPDADVPRQ